MASDIVTSPVTNEDLRSSMSGTRGGVHLRRTASPRWAHEGHSPMQFWRKNTPVRTFSSQ
ncbi:MAG: hypothetical protein MZV64_36295 [Ignavibacteriales bacterium]|nr:hypothetical protein [Ignavibacteriales bacterium]